MQSIHQTALNIPSQEPLHEAPGLRRFLRFGYSQRLNSFDQFQWNQTKPVLQPTVIGKYFTPILHPRDAKKLLKGCQDTGEPLNNRLSMYSKLHALLSPTGRAHLENLLNTGALLDASADDNHSTLYHLYAMALTPRFPGLDAKQVIEQTVQLLNQAYLIDQRFAPLLDERDANAMLSAVNNPGLNRARELTPIDPLSRKDLDVEFSSDCVPASLMYYMADKRPSELARHLNELTSPMCSFFEKATLSEISPDDPQKAYEILDYYDIPYHRSGLDTVTVKVELPIAAKYRMLNDMKYAKPGTRTGIETAYQSALAYLPTRSYSPATGQRDATEAAIGIVKGVKSLSDEHKIELIEILQKSKSPAKTYPPFLKKLNMLKTQLSVSSEDYQTIRDALKAQSRGLTEIEKTLLETIIKDNGGVTSVTYQVVAGKANPQDGEDSQSYLYGYTRSFDKTLEDIYAVLAQQEFVTLGMTETDETGAIVGGHEITITGIAEKDGEVLFEVVDTDDGVPKPVKHPAKSLIPKIHHMGLPTKLAQKVNKEIEATPDYFVPNAKDKYFQPISILNEPYPQDEALPEAESPTKPLEHVTAKPTAKPIEKPVEKPVEKLVTQPTQPKPASVLTVSQPLAQPTQATQPLQSYYYPTASQAYYPPFVSGYGMQYPVNPATQPLQSYYYPTASQAYYPPFVSGYGMQYPVNPATPNQSVYFPQQARVA